MTAYYNENDAYAAQWLRHLIAAGHIAPGDVDERSIVDVRADDLIGYHQCHFFAGIGGWSYALRLAGWTDNRSVWTGSCPCQPFSAAGAGKAADDKRHLWPAWFPLIAERRPSIVFGEQVEAAIGWGWLDAVFSDLEAAGYACGASVLPACSVGAPHIRQRLWFVADSERERTEWRSSHKEGPSNPRSDSAGQLLPATGARGATGGLADANGSRQRQGRSSEAGSGRDAPWVKPTGLCAPSELEHTTSNGRIERGAEPGGWGVIGGCGTGELGNAASDKQRRPWLAKAGERSSSAAGRSGAWDDLEWLPCTDGKARPVKSRAQRLANGLLASPSRLCPDRIAEVEKEIVNASHTFDAGKALHDLWLSLWPKAFQWTIGGLDGVHGAWVLLAFMRQLTEQGWSFSESISRASAQTHEGGLRGLRRDEAAPCTSCGGGLDEQRSAECPNSLHLLSSILARHAQAAWGEAFDANAKAAFPLQHGVLRRPSKLRAYGNAIVPQIAAEFIKATEQT